MRHLLVLATMLGASALFLLGWSHSTQKANSQPETMPLVPMMQQLLTDMQQADRGLYTENYDMIKEAGGNISNHPTMTPEDKQLVKSTLGDEMKQFVEYDMIVHHHADSMRIAAIQENMQKVLQHYAIVQRGCVDCHTAFRTPISSARQDSKQSK